MTLRQGEQSHAAIHFTGARRRVLSAFILGVAISAAGLAALASGVAGARGPFVRADQQDSAVDSAPARSQDSDRISIVHYTAHADRRRDDEEDAPRRRHGVSLRASIKFAGGHDPVCVRLCDGFFFPLPTAASDVMSQGQACNSLCPDAPTEVYYRNGSDRIEDSYSVAGKPYTALPVSLRYRTASNDTCSCHREQVAYAPLKDETLKRGDAIMTPAGFMVFRGVEGAPHQTGDFSALSASGLPASTTAPLKEMERASLTPAHPSLKDWLATQRTPTLAYSAPPARVAVIAPVRPAPAARSASGSIRLLAWRGRDE